MKKTGINMEYVKRKNRSLILHTINRAGPLSRKDLASLTHLTPASITQTTTALLEEGILREAGFDSDGGVGRHKILLDVNADRHKVCTVNIEAEETTIALCDCKGNLLRSGDKDLFQKIRTNRKADPSYFLREIAGHCRELIGCLAEEEQKQIRFVSVGLAGIVDRKNAVSLHAFGIWNEEVEVGKILNGELGLPVLLSNNVDAFAMAELLYGTGRTQDDLLIIKWGPGVGCTIVIDNEIYEGKHGKTAEIGHYIVEPDGEPCSCGRRGCLETVVSYNALSRLLPFKPEEFGEAYEKASGETAEAIRQKIGLFARCIVNTGTILAPDRIILCGSLFRGENIRQELIRACRSYDPSYREERILYTSLSEKEGYIGPCAVFTEHLLDGEKQE